MRVCIICGQELGIYFRVRGKEICEDCAIEIFGLVIRRHLVLE